MKTITIELRYDADDPEQEKVIILAAKRGAKHLLTQAMMLSGDRQPKILVHNESLIFGKDEIDLEGDLDEAE